MGHLLLEEFVYVFNMDGHEVDGIVVEYNVDSFMKVMLYVHVFRYISLRYNSGIYRRDDSNNDWIAYMGKISLIGETPVLVNFLTHFLYCSSFMEAHTEF